MKRITDNKLERLEVAIVYICIAVHGEKCFLGHIGFLVAVPQVATGKNLPRHHVASLVYCL